MKTMLYFFSPLDGAADKNGLLGSGRWPYERGRTHTHTPIRVV